MRRILYLHGYQSGPRPDKTAAMERYLGPVTAPHYDYDRGNRVPEIVTLVETTSFDALVGSSLGGYLGYHLSARFGLPALLFNPALNVNVPRRYGQQIMATLPAQTAFRRVVLGAQDDVVPPDTTLEYLGLPTLPADETIVSAHLTVHYRPDLAHQIPLDVFEAEVIAFARHLSRG